MCSSEIKRADCACAASAVTMVELVIVIVVTALLLLIGSRLVFQGTQTFVFVPNALAVNAAGSEALQQIIEGGFSTLSGVPIIRGLRFGGAPIPVGTQVAQPTLWLAENNRIGFRTAGGQDVLLWWDQTPNQEVIWRRLATAACPPAAGPEEVLSAQTQGTVRMLQVPPAIPIFQYYNQSGALVSPPGCSLAGITTIRRIDIRFMAQTRTGNFDQAQAQQTMTSAVAIRVP